MERLGPEVERQLGGGGEGAATPVTAIARVWAEAVGEEIARAAWPQRVARDGTLHVSTASSVWAFELERLEPEIRATLRATLGDATPSRLRFRPGPIPEPPPGPESVPADPPPVHPEDAERAAALAARVDDPELRELVARAAAASLSRARSDRHF
jgi:hypothetical protein